jgi:two-component system, sensor histidine kinase YesM
MGNEITPRPLAGFLPLNRLLKPGSIRNKFILSFMVLALVPMILFAFFSYRTYLGILQRNVQSYTSEVIDRVDRNLQIYLSDLEHILELRNDYYNLQFIKLSMAGDIEGNRKYTFRLWENLNNIKKIKTNLRDVAITTANGVSVGCYGMTHIDREQNELFRMIAKRNAKDDTMLLWGPHPDWLGGNVFSVGRAIRGDYDNFLGIMSIDVETELLDRICRNIKLGKSGYVMLADQDGRIIYHPKNNLIGKPVSLLLGKPSAAKWNSGFFTTRIGLVEQVVTVKTISPAQWKIIGLSNKAELTAEMQNIAGISLALILGLLVAITIVGFFLSGLLTRPIEELQQTMRRAAEDLSTNVDLRTHDEIGQLGETFNQMLSRIRQLMEQSVQEQKKLRRTEMIALQEQIKPHFIYNTLDLIIGLLETNKNEDVINMVEALGAFFRISLSQGQEFITIREEMAHIGNYLYIQRFRHGDKYDYLFDVDERIFGTKTLKLILQPLVENAIYHGVRGLEKPGGLITVRGYWEEKSVFFVVLDNGLGMEPELTEEINRCLEGIFGVEQEKRFFGLRNVNERIKLAFGKEYGLRLISSPGVGTQVIVHLPLLQDNQVLK